MNIIGQRLRAARALRGFNQAQLAVKMGLTREAISMIEPGRSRICVFRRKWNTDFGGTGTPISEEVEHRFRDVEHGFRDVEHPFRGKWNTGSGVVNARR